MLKYDFNSRVRNANESVSMFVAELRKLTKYWQYGDLLNDMLRERLVCGINYERAQQRLLSKGSTLSIEKALDIQSGYTNSKTETPVTIGVTDIT